MRSDYTPDPTEAERRELVRALNACPGTREYIEGAYGKCYDTKELQEEFQVHAFAAPFISVTRKSDGVKGLMMFQHDPRFYWGFEETT